MAQLTISIPDKLKSQLEDHVGKTKGVKVSTYIQGAIRDSLALDQPTNSSASSASNAETSNPDPEIG